MSECENQGHATLSASNEVLRAEVTKLDARIAELEVSESCLLSIRKFVDAQAEDSGLWFIAETAPEAYLQKALRELHAVAEATT